MAVQPPALTRLQSFHRDISLSWQARGMLAYIVDHGSSWVINVQHLIEASANDGRCVVQSALRELARANYHTIHITRDSHGHVCGKQYRLTDKQVYRQSENQSVGTDKQENRPTENLFFGGQNGVVADNDRQTENLSLGSPTSRFSDNRETGSITKKDLKPKTEERKKDLAFALIPETSEPNQKTTYSPGFLTYHAVHPVKKGKAKAWAIWKRKKLEPLTGVIVQSVIDHIQYDPQWSKGFIKHLDGYLSAQCWEDELDMPSRDAATTTHFVL